MPKKDKGLLYFDVHTDINNDMRVKLFQAEFGMKGFGIWMQLLIQIYGDEGYFMNWNNDTKLLLASDVGETGGVVGEVVDGLVRRGLFDKSVFDRFDVLTSKHIQEKYLNAIKRRTTETEIDARFLSIPLNADIITGNDNIKLLRVDKSTQSRERVEEEEDESRGRDARPPGKCSLESFEKHRGITLDREDVQDWMNDNKLTLSDEEFDYELERLRDKFSEKRYKDWLAVFRNYLRSRYLEPEHWDFKKPQTNGNNQKSKGSHRADVLRDIEDNWPG